VYLFSTPIAHPGYRQFPGAKVALQFGTEPTLESEHVLEPGIKEPEKKLC